MALRNEYSGSVTTSVPLTTSYGLAAADRLTLQQQANALIADITRADGILSRLSPVPTNDGATDPDLPLGHALQVAHERMAAFIERLDGLALLVGQI